MGCTEWVESNQKNKPQSNAIGTGVLTLLATGMYHAGTLYDPGYKNHEWTYDRSDSTILVTLILFHIAAILGSLTGWFLIERYTKKQINFVIMSLVVIGCTVSIALPHNLIGIAFARGLMGIAHGMAYLVVLIHGGEILIKELRGVIMAAVNFCIISGILIGGAMNNVEVESLAPYQFMGIIGLVYMPLAFFLNLIVCYESPVFLMKRNLDSDAIRSMIKLRNESTETWEIRNEMTEFKTMLSEDASTTRSIFREGNLRPLVLIALGKIASVLSFNYAVNTIKVNVIEEVLNVNDTNARLSIVMVTSIRMVVGLCAMFLVDVLGRRALQLVSTVSTGMIMIAMGITYIATDTITPDIAMAIFLACEVGASLGLTFIPDVLCSEAFNTQKKALSIVAVHVLENVLHVIVFSVVYKWDFTVYDRYGGTLLVAGIPLLVIGYILYRKLPETSKMSIRQARIEFYKREGIVFGGSKNSVEVLYD
ncbi:solute carrier family 2, facilitated glucose transporter member 5-like [Anopheles funestus]|uniref:solute carrier family 2, facilitated glucose transporter member 5-like n=1 Tax=Anopheles funestus TaxID=62324 RepID=UPI0020C5B628|nr:solute carrier family 2, facilitated glucose transporter member 5-like [Anopheles funestus]